MQLLTAMKSRILFRRSTPSKATSRLSFGRLKVKSVVSHLGFPRTKTVLSGLKLSAAVAGSLGSSVPIVQNIANATTTIITHVEAVEQNKQECRELAALAMDIVIALVVVTEGIDESHMLAELEWRLERTSATLEQLNKHHALRRLFLKDQHAELLVEHRQSLQNALVFFEAKQSTQMHMKISDLVDDHKALISRMQDASCVQSFASAAIFL